MRKKHWISICGIVALYSSSLYADEGLSERVFSVVGDSTIDRAAAPASARVEINASQDSSKVAMRVGTSVSDRRGRKGVFSTWALTTSAPLNESDDKTDLATLDSLTNAFTASVKYSRFTVTGVQDKPLGNEADAKLFDEICAAMWQNYRDVRDATEEQATELECDTANVKEFAAGRYATFRGLFWDPQSLMYFWGLEGTVGNQNFDYKDAETFSSKDESKTPWSVKAFLGVMPSEWNTLIALGADYQVSYKDAEKQTICPANDGSGPVVCQTGSFANPDDDDRQLVYLEMRRTIGRAGVSLKLTRDFEEDTTGIDLPVFLIRDPKGNLTGGIRAGWRDDTDNVEFGVFVGSKFSVLN